MNESQHKSGDGFKLLARVETLRSDQRGSVTLLAGLMMFLVTMFGIIAMDTNMAIYNRVISQNAVDAAAESAVLWQARFCNIEQELNNLHYDVDEALSIAEDAAAAACVASAVLLAAELAADAFFGAGEAAIRPARMVTCALCATMPWIDLAQQLFYAAIIPIQKAIVDAAPYVCFVYANACAQGSGADTIGDALGGTVESLLSDVGVSVPGLNSIASALGSIPIYTVPLDPDGFGLFDPADKGLYVTETDGNNGWPLDQPEWVGTAGDVGGYIGCEDSFTPLEESESYAEDAQWDGTDSYGWNDNYMKGHPGFNTWIAGKKGQAELLGLGNLTWLNGDKPTAANSELQILFKDNTDTASKSIYTGGINRPGNTMQIPGFIAIASSQVEGTPVIEDTSSVNAQGKLIKVYIPGGSSPTAGDTYYIYH